MSYSIIKMYTNRAFLIPHARNNKTIQMNGLQRVFLPLVLFFISSCTLQFTTAFKNPTGPETGAQFLNISPRNKGFSGSITSKYAHKLDGITISNPLKPVGDKIFIKLKETEKTTPGGLVLPTEQRVKQGTGKVIAVASEIYNKLSRTTIPSEIKPGDWIIFSRNNIVELKYDDNDCALISYDDALAKVSENEFELDINNLKPLKDMVFIKLNKESKKTPGGLILSQQRKNTFTNDGEVIAVGQGTYDNNGKRLPIEVKGGDKVRFSSYASENEEFKINGEKYTILSIDDIIAKW